jgi:type IX secretion system PorP/SprF family membrane protein
MLLYSVLCLWLAKNAVMAQDVHFTQFFTTPMQTNPANTSMFDGNIRFASNYRNQWSAIGTPYNTLYASLDGSQNIFNQSFGLGCMIVRDQTAYNLEANEVMLSLSYSKIINNQQFTIGIQPGYAIKSYNYNSLYFGSQFDTGSEAYNSGLSSNENLGENIGYFDLNAGMFWRTVIQSVMPSVGFSVSHILQPTVSYATSGSTKLPMKFTLNSQVVIPLDDKIDLTPSLLWGYTTGVGETLLGCIEGYKISNYRIPVQKIYAINMFRVNPFSNIDAFILGCGFKFRKFDIGLTYDYNISSLSGTSNFNGAYELSIVYTGNRNKKRKEACDIY